MRVVVIHYNFREKSEKMYFPRCLSEIEQFLKVIWPNTRTDLHCVIYNTYNWIHSYDNYCN